MTGTRNATGTPIRELFGFSEHLSDLQAQVEAMQADLCRQQTSIRWLWLSVVEQQRELDQLRQMPRNDLRLSEVLGRVEQGLQGVTARLAAMQMGGELS